MFINASSGYLRERQVITRNSSKGQSGGLKTAAVIGIAVGIVVLIIMCVGMGYWSCARTKKRQSLDEEAGPNRPRSASYGSQAGMVHNTKSKTAVVVPPMVELSIPTIREGMSSMELAESDYDSVSNLSYGSSYRERVRPTLPRLSRRSTLKMPTPRHDSAPSSPVMDSPSQWSLFPKDERPWTAVSSRPSTARSRVPRMASSNATSEVSLRTLAPVSVKVVPSPIYAASEYASVYQKRQIGRAHV